MQNLKHKSRASPFPLTLCLSPSLMFMHAHFWSRPPWIHQGFSTIVKSDLDSALPCRAVSCWFPHPEAMLLQMGFPQTAAVHGLYGSV